MIGTWNKSNPTWPGYKPEITNPRFSTRYDTCSNPTCDINLHLSSRTCHLPGVFSFQQQADQAHSSWRFQGGYYCSMTIYTYMHFIQSCIRDVKCLLLKRNLGIFYFNSLLLSSASSQSFYKGYLRHNALLVVCGTSLPHDQPILRLFVIRKHNNIFHCRSRWHHARYVEQEDDIQRYGLWSNSFSVKASTLILKCWRK